MTRLDSRPARPVTPRTDTAAVTLVRITEDSPNAFKQSVKLIPTRSQKPVMKPEKLKERNGVFFYEFSLITVKYLFFPQNLCSERETQT